ncbi:hypothetical protein LHN18_003702 [Acinetobacter baumannii]|nr:hypothetical protein [Acinetobacter baumannii]
MPNDRNSPLDTVLANLLGSDVPSRPDQKAVSFRIDFDNYVNLCALQSIGPKGFSRNQLLNDLLAVAIDQVVSSLPDGASDAYEEAVIHNEVGLTMILETEGHL